MLRRFPDSTDEPSTPITRSHFEKNLYPRLQEQLGWAGALGLTHHYLRHTIGTRIERHAGPAVADAFLGHAATSVTAVYTRAPLDDVVAAWCAITGHTHPMQDR